MEPQKARYVQIDWGYLGQNGDSEEVDLGGEIDFDISGITLESIGTSEGQVRTIDNLKLSCDTRFPTICYVLSTHSLIRAFGRHLK